MNLKNFLIIFIISLLFSINIVLAEIVNDIKVKGNKRIVNESIIDYGKISLNKNYTLEDLNDIQKKIFSQGYFEKVNLQITNGILIIEVVENPLINFFTIQGEKNAESLNKLYDYLEIKPNKIYSDFILNKDLEKIKNLYYKDGYHDVEVIPRVSLLNDNKVNIIISVDKKERFYINRIYFIGNKKFKTSELLNVVSSSEKGWWKFLSNTTIINNERILFDQVLLKNYYLDHGYYDAQITSVQIKKIQNDRADLIFSINSGDLYDFGNFKISEGTNLINNESLTYINSLKQQYLASKYSKKNINIFLNKITTHFIDNNINFVEAGISQIKKEKLIDLDLKLTALKNQIISKIDIKGNGITEEEVIRRKLTFSEGDNYTNFKKNQSLDNLNSSQIFDKVNISVSEEQDSTKKIFVDVTEKPTGSLYAGAGYGSNGGSVFFGVNEKNFLGKGIITDAKMSFGTQKIDGTISAIIPDFAYSSRDLYTNVYSTKTSLTNTLYESKKSGFDLGTRYELYDNLFLKPGIGLDYDKIDVINTASSYLRSQDGNYVTQKISYNLERDERDKKINTKEGYLLGFSQELAALFTDIPYVKNSIYASNYIQVFNKKQTLTLKYGYTNITAINNESIKLSDRLSLPSQLAKGFETRSYGPKDSSSGDYIGGNNSIYSLASISIPTPFQESSNIDTVAFINAFDLWGTDNSLAKDSSTIRSSIGIGLDWRSPLGPVNFSLAKALTKEKTDKTKTFSFEIGTVF